MADCLMYWKEFWDNPSQPYGDYWYTKQSHFCKQVNRGDSLWVVVWGGPNYPDEWRLLQKIKIQGDCKYDPQYNRPYHVVGDPQNFDIRTQSDLTPLLHRLDFVSGKKIKLNGKKIGRALQTIRPLRLSDVKLLEQYASKLKTLD